MAENNKVTIEITGKIDGFVQAVKEAQKEVKDINDVLADVGKSAAIAFAALTAEAFLALKAFGENERAVNSLSQSLKNQGIASDSLVKKYIDQADALEELTGANDDQIIKGQALLQSNLGAIEITQELTKAVIDLAAGTGDDLDTAFAKVAKTIGSSTNALAREGIEVEANATKQEKLSQIITGINKKHEGQAEAALKGVGSLTLLRNAIDDLQKAIGSRLAPAFEKIVISLTGFINSIKDNKPLLDFIVAAGSIAGIFTGLVTAISAGGLAFTGLKVALAGITSSIAPILAGLAAISTAIYLVAEAMGFFKGQQSEQIKTVDHANDRIKELTKTLRGLYELQSQGSDETARIKKVTAELEAAYVARSKLSKLDEEQAEQRKKLADEQANNLNKEQAIDLEKRRAHQELVRAELDGASQEQLDLIKQRSETYLELINAKNQEERDLIADHQQKINEGIVVQQELDEETRRLTLEKEKELSLQKVEIGLKEQEILRQISREEAAEKLAFYKQQLKTRAEHGVLTAKLAEIEKTKQFQFAEKSSHDLIALQQSENATLKAIGKAAATTQIIINTARTASSVFDGAVRAFGVPAGPVIGAALAAAAVAFGAEQISKVASAQEGGIVPNAPGNVRVGTDTVPTILTPGEIVVPTKNFDEVINAVAASRASEGTTGVSTGLGAVSQQAVEVIIGFRDNAIEIIEQKLLERRAVGVGSL